MPEYTFHFFIPRDRSGRVRWLLEELQLSYEAIPLDYDAGESKSPEYLRRHPLGWVPALESHEGILLESGAICLFLADKHSLGTLAPQLDDPRRGEYLQWMFFGPATIDPAVSAVWEADKLPDPVRKTTAEASRKHFDRVADMIERQVQQRAFLIGDEFTTADIVVALPLFWAQRSGLLEDRIAINRYLGELQNRPAAVRARIFL